MANMAFDANYYLSQYQDVRAAVDAGKITAEQGKDIIDELAKKGEITIEQGKKIVEQLKTADKETGAAENEFGTMNFESMDDEKLARLKEEIEKIENERKGNQE